MTGRGHTRKFRPADLLEISSLMQKWPMCVTVTSSVSISHYGSATFRFGSARRCARRALRDLPHGKGILEQRHWQSGRSGLSAPRNTRLRRSDSRRCDLAMDSRSLEALVARIKGEFIEMPGVRLTADQGRRVWGLDCDRCREVLCVLVKRRFLTLGADGTYHRTTEGTLKVRHRMAKLSSISAHSASMPAGRRAAARSSRD